MKKTFLNFKNLLKAIWENNQIITTSHTQKFGSDMTMKELLINNGLI